MIFTAVIISAVVVVLIFSVDFGWMSFAKNRAQAAVDSAALSGAAALPHYNTGGDSSRVDNLVKLFNGVDSSTGSNTVVKMNPDIEIDDVTFVNYQAQEQTVTDLSAIEYEDANGLRVQKDYSIPLFFGRFLGLKDWDFTVNATAVMGGVGCFIPDLPIVLLNNAELAGGDSLCREATCGSDVTIAITSDANVDTVGYWSFLDDEDETTTEQSSAAECKRKVIHGITRPICVGDKLNCSNGTVTSCENEIAKKCDDCGPGNTWNVIVPVVENDELTERNGNGNCNQQVTVLGFAYIGLTKVEHKTYHFRRVCGLDVDATGGGKSCGIYAKTPVLIE